MQRVADPAQLTNGADTGAPQTSRQGGSDAVTMTGGGTCDLWSRVITMSVSWGAASTAG